MGDQGSTRVDAWTWSVRLYKSRSEATSACRAGHVKVNGRKAKPALALQLGDRVEALTAAGPRVVVVTRLLTKRVGAAIAASCFEDHTPPPAPREVWAAVPTRDRGAGRPTKRDRRLLDRLRGH